MSIKKLYIFGPRSMDGLECIDYFKTIKDVKVYPYYVDITDSYSLRKIIEHKPDFIINFAAVTRGSDAENNPEIAIEINTVAVAGMLNLIKELSPTTRFASIGSIEEFSSNNIYAISKRAARDVVRHYRDTYKLNCCHLILSHHQSKYQKVDFITRKITNWVAKAKFCIERDLPIAPLEVGNLDTRITFIPAKHVILGIYRALNYNPIEDFLFSSTDKHSIREALEFCMSFVGIKFERLYRNTNDYSCVEYLDTNGIPLINFNHSFFERRREIDFSFGINVTMDALNWGASGGFRNILEEMINYDIALLNKAS